MDWIFIAFFVAAAIHVVEEFVFPGGFLAVMRSFRPQYARFVTARFAVVINSLFLCLCVAAAVVAASSPVFSLSVASLLFFNALLHMAATAKLKRYVPGVISGVLLYIPLSLYAYALFVSVGQVTLGEGLASGLLGILYQLVPIAYLAVARIARTNGEAV